MWIFRPHRYVRWIFGSIERNTNKCFIVTVPDRKSRHFCPSFKSIFAWCNHNLGQMSCISTNQWTSRRLYTPGCKTFEEFVDPETGATTNHIEFVWQKFKMENKKRYGTDRNLFDSYFSEYCCRKLYRGPDTMYHLWAQIASLQNYRVEI